MNYRGLQIKTTQDFGLRQKNAIGYCVTDGTCNVLPGGTYAHTPHQARKLIDAYIESGGPVQRENEDYNDFFKRHFSEPVDAQKFWSIVQPA